MADEETEREDSPEKPKGGLLKKILLGTGAIVLIAVGIVVGPLVLNRDAEPEMAEGEGVADESELADNRPELYQSLLPPLVINITDEFNEPHFMQVSMDVMSRDQDVINRVREHTPVIRNNLILLYGSAKYESVITREGKEKLLQDGLDEIRTIMNPYIEGDADVEAVYFTALVVQ